MFPNPLYFKLRFGILAGTAILSVLCKASSNLQPTVSGGLQNLGNTCYMNAQLQCQFHIPLVRRLIAEREEANTALGSLQQVFRTMEDASVDGRGAVNPRTLCSNLGINVYEQQDSQEFWKLLLPELNLPPLADLYTGAYQDYIISLDGSDRERRREEAFLDLSLDVAKEGDATEIQNGDFGVYESLRHQFGEPELLTKDNAWRPEKGAPKVDAHKGSALLDQGLPSILQLHLKRFQFDWNTETTSKLNHRFSFPQELDMADLLQEDPDCESSDSCYDLQAIVVHMGEFSSGHYYAYVRPDIDSNEWYRFNDATVTKVSFREVIADAYGGKCPHSNDHFESKKRFWLFRLILFIFGRVNNGTEPYGFGGRTSNAYVLQYVRRCKIAKLYERTL